MASAIAASASILHKAISFLSSKSSREIHLKEEQDIAIKSLLKEKDVLAVLPTGFGKCLVSQVFAVVRSLLSLESTSSNGSVLVVCPLKSIISDQIEEARSLGLTALEFNTQESLKSFLDCWTNCLQGWFPRCDEKTTRCSFGCCG